jgi:HEAT repeat protein
LKDGSIKGQAAWALVQIGEPAIRELIIALKGNNSWMAAQALEAIGKPAVPALNEVIQISRD